MKQVPAGWLPLDRTAGDRSGQIYRGLRARILAGELPGGGALPSTRALADSLGIARSTVVIAYDRLRAEGFLEASTGAATRVAHLPPAAASRTAPSVLPALAAPNARGDFAPGLPDLTSFPHAIWARYLGARARALRVHDLGYSAYHGLAELRAAVLAHVAAQRGVLADPEQVLIVPSTSAALTMLARLCIRPDRRVVWMEDPGYTPARAIFLDAGARLVPMPVDADGADASDMPGPLPTLIYTTPSHQYPVGVTMSLARRLALIEAARLADALILEDDYDSEFLAAPSIAALQSIDRAGVVAYLGTFSKVLAPGLRIAYAILPTHLVAPARTALARSGIAVPIHVQAALADFIEDGRLRAHIRHIGPVYRANAAALAEILERTCGTHLSIGAARGGLQLAAWFRNRAIDDRTVAAQLAADGFGPSPLSDHSLERPGPGLLFGTACLDPKRAAALGRRLAAYLDPG